MLTTAFLQDIRDAAQLPNSTVPGTDDTRLLRMADVVMRSVMVGFVRSISEEFYIYHVDLTSPAAQLSIRLPSAAVGSSVRTVDYFAGPTNSQTGFNLQMLRHLERIEPERLPSFQVTDQYRGLPWGFYMEASTVNLVPIPAGLGALRVRYQQRPGQLVIDTDTTQSAQVTSVGSATINGVDCWVLASAGSIVLSTCDVIANTSPYETLVSNVTPDAFAAGTVSIAKWKFQTPPNVGDWFVKVGVSPVVQLPEECESMAATLVAASVLRAKGRGDHARLLEDAAGTMRTQVSMSMAPRTKGNSRVVTGGLRNQTHGPWGNFRVG